MVRLERRREHSRTMTYLTPVLAVVLTLIAGAFMFAILGHDPGTSLYTFFISPITSKDGIAELMVKATPLVLIAVGLALGFRANVWNIGAEGQLTVGALAGGGLALALYPSESVFLMPAMFIVAILGGMAWGAIPAWLKTHFNCNEILTSLMLTYIATLALAYFIHGPMKDPSGFNFPESRQFQDAATLPIIWAGTRLHIGWLVALLAVVTGWVLINRHLVGFQIKVIGQAPMAARFAGFSQNWIIWFVLLVAGGLSGLAGLFEVTGPIGQIVPIISPGYGFTAIIVAFLGRLHPVGILFAGLLMALTYLGGEAAQIALNMPNAVTGVFQGMILFFLLACDVFVAYRIRFTRPVPEKA
jgi:simple sugar transport system permease protein